MLAARDPGATSCKTQEEAKEGSAVFQCQWLSTGVRCGTLSLAPRPDTRNTTTSAKLTPSRPKNYLRAAPVGFYHSACIRLATASSRPLFITDLCAAPPPLAPRPDPHGQMAGMTWASHRLLPSTIYNGSMCYVQHPHPSLPDQTHTARWPE
jgi:hypothetical protein